MYVASEISCSISNVFQKETAHKFGNSGDFVNSDNESEYESQESDSDSEELPPTLQPLNLRTPCPLTKSQVPLKMLVVMEAD
jgi:hypothetical protein